MGARFARPETDPQRDGDPRHDARKLRSVNYIVAPQQREPPTVFRGALTKNEHLETQVSIFNADIGGQEDRVSRSFVGRFANRVVHSSVVLGLVA